MRRDKSEAVKILKKNNVIFTLKYVKVFKTIKRVSVLFEISWIFYKKLFGTIIMIIIKINVYTEDGKLVFLKTYCFKIKIYLFIDLGFFI